mmetsp:Transcript_21858/g.45628  ORF Transcript_21858/g.45628 Transcript_21858/m.45628 type:complete len:254 (+) Transcript_21858:223-984(+)
MRKFFKGNASIVIGINDMKGLERVSVIEFHPQISQETGKFTGRYATIAVLVVIGKDQEQKGFIGQGIAEGGKFATGVDAHNDGGDAHDNHETARVNVGHVHLRHTERSGRHVQQSTTPQETKNIEIAGHDIAQMGSSTERIAGQESRIQNQHKEGHDNDAHRHDNGMGGPGIRFHDQSHHTGSNQANGAHKGGHAQETRTFFRFVLPFHQMTIEQTVQVIRLLLQIVIRLAFILRFAVVAFVVRAGVHLAHSI